MATLESIGRRRAEAMGRIEAAIEALAGRFDLTISADAFRVRRAGDPELARTKQLAAFADVLEQIVAATVPEQVPPTATPLVIDGIKPEHLDALAGAGITNLDDLREASDEMILAVDGIGPKTLERIRAHLAELPE